jgi:nitrous oxide reductase accessory protein NosL
MLKSTRLLICILFLSIPCAAAETEKCAVCGMQVDVNAPFSAQIVQGKQVLQFCDIGDLLLYLGGKQQAAGYALVKDYRTGAWVPAARAFFVHAPLRFTTPMGWSIAAFKDRAAAEEYGTPVDLAAVMKRVVQ